MLNIQEVADHFFELIHVSRLSKPLETVDCVHGEAGDVSIYTVGNSSTRVRLYWLQSFDLYD